jgi:hypothetical protein
MESPFHLYATLVTQLSVMRLASLAKVEKTYHHTVSEVALNRDSLVLSLALRMKFKETESFTYPAKALRLALPH